MALLTAGHLHFIFSIHFNCVAINSYCKSLMLESRRSWFVAICLACFSKSDSLDLVFCRHFWADTRLRSRFWICPANFISQCEDDESLLSRRGRPRRRGSIVSVIYSCSMDCGIDSIGGVFSVLVGIVYAVEAVPEKELSVGLKASNWLIDEHDACAGDKVWTVSICWS